ncbi:MAG TPA: hypothetical protein VNA69_19700 [Thermoanaerobaculia bacterium]|nr:hypothetical protein [Thermoanaerobaculia bacterium]
MIRLGSLLVLMASIGFVSVTDAVYADDVGIVIAIHRSAGFRDPELTKPMDYYQFTVVKDGNWELKPLKGESRKGKLDAEDLDEWLEAIEDGLDEVESDPMLGALDEPYMDITVRINARKTQVRIRLSEELSQTIETKIVELAKPGK